MLQFLNIAEIIVAILLTVSILLQNKGAGLSSTFGGGDMGGYYTKRGFEKFLLNFSVILSVAFLALAIANLIVQSQMA